MGAMFPWCSPMAVDDLRPDEWDAMQAYVAQQRAREEAGDGIST